MPVMAFMRDPARLVQRLDRLLVLSGELSVPADVEGALTEVNWIGKAVTITN